MGVTLPSGEPLLRVSGLKTWFGGDDDPTQAVDGVDFEIYPGETFALLGESGCGKSVTALSMMRLLPTAGRIVSGEIHLGQRSLLKLPENAMRNERGGRMGMIFQEPMTSLNPVLSIGDQITESIRMHDPEALDNPSQRALELLQAVGIPDPSRRLKEYPHQLSGGMKQRVMIAIALAGRPQLLIADEPTTALDVTIQAQVLSLLKGLQKESGMAILMITHDLGVVSEVADRVAVMYAGQIVEQAPVDRFFSDPLHPYSRKLFHSVPARAKRGQQLAVIEGNVPLLNQHFEGCRFYERCDLSEPRCKRETPKWREIEDSEALGVRCLLDVATPLPETVQADGMANTEVGALDPSPLLKVEGLEVHFPIRRGVLKRVVGRVKAVDGVSLSIPSGRTLALVGESGCGKTTVGKGILQLIRPTSGHVWFDGDELTELKGEALRRRRSDLQIIFQDPFSSMNPRMLVGAIIGEGMSAQGFIGSHAERNRRVVQLLEQVGLPAEAISRYPHEFSGGQRQRICIARALAVKPRLIVCDEPTSALDVSVQAQVLNLLKSLQDELGLSYLFITHNLSVVDYLTHDIAVMYLGRIVEMGHVDEVLQNPQHPYTRALLSAVPQMEPGQQRAVIRLEGDMPSPAKPPQGCYFHPRCPEVRPECKSAYPEMVSLSGSHKASCIRLLPSQA